jgi:hypothetical protein
MGALDLGRKARGRRRGGAGRAGAAGSRAHHRPLRRLLWSVVRASGATQVTPFVSAQGIQPVATVGVDAGGCGEGPGAASSVLRRTHGRGCPTSREREPRSRDSFPGRKRPRGRSEWPPPPRPQQVMFVDGEGCEKLVGRAATRPSAARPKVGTLMRSLPRITAGFGQNQRSRVDSSNSARPREAALPHLSGRELSPGRSDSSGTLRFWARAYKSLARPAAERVPCFTPAPVSPRRDRAGTAVAARWTATATASSINGVSAVPIGGWKAS